MRNSTVFLMALALALISLEQTVAAIPPPDLPLRRSRFLVSANFPPPPPPSSLFNCNKMCKYTEACCHGKCVDTFTDDKNCGGCGVKCRTKCTNGYCDYAA